MQWIESKGGPLVLVEEEHVAQWRGADGDSSGRAQDGTDYDRACQVDDYVAVVPTGSGTALVLGDEPHRTTWVERPSGGLIVRWVYSDCEESIQKALEGGEVESALADDGLEFHVGSGSARLFDSVDPGTEVQGVALSIQLEPGDYAVATAEISPSEEVRFIVHSLRRVPS